MTEKKTKIIFDELLMKGKVFRFSYPSLPLSSPNSIQCLSLSPHSCPLLLISKTHPSSHTSKSKPQMEEQENRLNLLNEEILVYSLFCALECNLFSQKLYS